MSSQFPLIVSICTFNLRMKLVYVATFCPQTVQLNLVVTENESQLVFLAAEALRIQLRVRFSALIPMRALYTIVGTSQRKNVEVFREQTAQTAATHDAIPRAGSSTLLGLRQTRGIKSR